MNEQLQKDYYYTSINGFGVYTFKKMNKQYVIRLDYQGNLSKKKHEEYLGTYKDFGWSCIKSWRFGNIHYWQKENIDQNEIFQIANKKDVIIKD